MAPISLEAFLSGQVFKMPILEVFVHMIIDDTTYLIADNTRVARMTVKQNPKLGKNISCNISVRIVNAIVEDEIVVLTPSTHILHASLCSTNPQPWRKNLLLRQPLMRLDISQLAATFHLLQPR